MDSSSVAPVTVDNGQYQEYNNKLSTSTTRQKPSKGGWNAALFVIFVEVADRFAYYGLVGNLIMYLTKVLGQPMATAAKNVNLWIGVSSLFPVLGALVADSFLGRFKTILLSSIIYLTGMVMLSLSVAVIPLHYRKVVFFVSLYVLSVGEGGHKPCVQTFAADQFDEDSPEEKEAKSSFFNWWYLGIVAGATVAMLLVIYIQDNISWTIGFSMLAAVLAVALVLFLLGIKRYRKQIPVGSPFTAVAQVLVAAARKWRVDGTRNSLGVYYGNERVLVGPVVNGQPGARPFNRTNKFRFLDKASFIDNQDESNETRNPWRLCSVNQVEEVKLVLRLIPIWLSCLMFTVVQAQIHTFFTKQGSTMIRSIGPHFQLPPALNFIKSSNRAAFLPRQASKSIPFASNKLPEIFSQFSVTPQSEEAEIVKQTIKECEEPGIKREEKYCATSLESMIDFSTSKLGKNVQALSTEVEKESGLQKYTITLVEKKTADEKSVVCHKQNYPYAVFYCHSTQATEAYKLSLKGADGTKAKAVAVCHKDTSAWNPKHLAFQVLKVKPGTVPVCHFLPEDHIVWVPKQKST